MVLFFDPCVAPSGIRATGRMAPPSRRTRLVTRNGVASAVAAGGSAIHKKGDLVASESVRGQLRQSADMGRSLPRSTPVTPALLNHAWSQQDPSGKGSFPHQKIGPGQGIIVASLLFFPFAS